MIASQCRHAIALRLNLSLSLTLPYVCPTFSWKCFRSHGDQSQREKLRLNLFLTLFPSFVSCLVAIQCFRTLTHTHRYTSESKSRGDSVCESHVLLLLAQSSIKDGCKRNGQTTLSEGWTSVLHFLGSVSFPARLFSYLLATTIAFGPSAVKSSHKRQMETDKPDQTERCQSPNLASKLYSSSARVPKPNTF